MIKAIIFDWGGVLTKGSWTSSLVTILSQKSQKTFEEVFEPIDRVVVDLDTDSISVNQAKEQINTATGLNLSIREVYHLFGMAIKPDSEIIDLLPRLKDYKLVMLSNNDIITTKSLRKGHKTLLELFDNIYFSFEFKIRKPGEEFFNLPLKDLNLKPEECVFIDDKKKNTDAAKALGFKTILYKNLAQLKQELRVFGVSL